MRAAPRSRAGRLRARAGQRHLRAPLPKSRRGARPRPTSHARDHGASRGAGTPGEKRATSRDRRVGCQDRLHPSEPSNLPRQVRVDTCSARRRGYHVPGSSNSARWETPRLHFVTGIVEGETIALDGVISALSRAATGSETRGSGTPPSCSFTISHTIRYDSRAHRGRHRPSGQFVTIDLSASLSASRPTSSRGGGLRDWWVRANKDPAPGHHPMSHHPLVQRGGGDGHRRARRSLLCTTRLPRPRCPQARCCLNSRRLTIRRWVMSRKPRCGFGWTWIRKTSLRRWHRESLPAPSWRPPHRPGDRGKLLAPARRQPRVQ